MQKLLFATAALAMLSSVAMAQSSNVTPQTPSNGKGYSTTGAMSSSNGAPVAPNGGLQSGVGTTLVNPSSPSAGQTSIPNGNGGGTSK